MLCEDYGGRVDLAKAYYKALTASVRKHFKGNGVIASMEHCNDFMFLGTEAISLGRVGKDHLIYYGFCTNFARLYFNCVCVCVCRPSHLRGKKGLILTKYRYRC